MTPTFEPFAPASGPLSALSLLRLERAGPVLHIRLNRPAKRNSVSDELLAQLHTVFVNLPKDVKAAVLSGEGQHFCAGLDLSEVSERNVFEGMQHSRAWHACFDAIQFGPVPVVAVLHGAVVGGGLELAGSAHLRVAEDSAFYGLPEGTRGIFVGGGGSVRISRLIGVARMTDMMLTGRVFDAADAERFGLVQYLTPPGEALAKGAGLANKIAAKAPMTAFAVMHALPRIVEQGPTEGLFTESLMSAVAANAPVAQARLKAFLEARAQGGEGVMTNRQEICP